MDWVKNINKTLAYIEENLADEINPQEIEKIMACPLAVFLRTFTEISGITLAEYIRRRRLSLAAYDLQNSGIKVIDTALKYGYTSPDSFRVAFKSLHGITPSRAKEAGVLLKFYSQLQFEIKIKGVQEMDYKLVEKGAFKVVGKRAVTPYGGGTWAIVKSDGTLEKLLAESKAEETLGLCFGFDEAGNNDYLCGVEWDNPQGLDYDSYEYPALKWLVFLAEGKLSDHVLLSTWERIKGEFLPDSRYMQLLDLPTIERYIVWDEAGDYGKVEVRIPVE